MRAGKHWAIRVAVLGCLTSGSASADTPASSSTEYLNRIKTAETISPLGPTPFGETIGLYSGSLGFRQTDIVYPGIGPTISLTRSYDANGSPLSYTPDMPMADWDLMVPRLRTIVVGEGTGVADQGTWIVDGPDPQARCTQFTVIYRDPAFSVPWWHGYQLETGDGNSQPLLKRTPENTLAPSGNAPQFGIVTPKHWMLSCLPTNSAGQAQETFLATSTDGTRYWFNRLQYGRREETLIEAVPKPKPALVAAPGDGTVDPNIYWGVDNIKLYRRIADMQATRVEDRFGNWLTYSYDATGRLTQIDASDGRQVVVAYRTDVPAFVDHITLQPESPAARTWRYVYSDIGTPVARRLSGVVLPDGSAWSFAMNSVAYLQAGSANPGGECNVRTFAVPPGTVDPPPMLMTHPSGLTGSFQLSVRGHGRSWVPTTCLTPVGETPHEPTQSVYLSLSLTARTLSGPGMAPATTQYEYSPAHASTVQECTAQACDATQWTEVTDPTGSTLHYTFSNRWDATEGRMLGVVSGVAQRGLDNPGGLQVDTSAFAPSSQGPFPSRLGQSMSDPDTGSNDAPSEVMTLESVHQTVRQGVTFSRQTTSFDRFGQPTTVVRSNSLGYSTTDITTYAPVADQWVLGAVARVSRGADTPSQTDYDARMLPLRSYEFGLLKASYGFNADGTLATMTDPLGHVTGLQSYFRAVPQRIQLADGSAILPTADTFGQVTSVRNQLGDATGYAYDAMGRVTRIDYPAGDEVAWTPTLRGFTQQWTTEYGIGPGHWTQVVSTGAGVSTTYFDAMFNPLLVVTEDTARPDSKAFVVNRFDATGRKTFTSYPVGTLGTVSDALPGLSSTYDALGRVVTVAQDSELGLLITGTEYLDLFKTRVTNPRGFQTTTGFQSFDAPSEEFPVRIEAPQGVLTVIQRDSYGKPLQITRSGSGG